MATFAGTAVSGPGLWGLFFQLMIMFEAICVLIFRKMTYRIVDVLERVLVVSFNAPFAHASLGVVLAILADTTRRLIRRFVDSRVKVTLGGMAVTLASWKENPLHKNVTFIFERGEKKYNRARKS